jgi:HEPN domain-containing protein
MGRTREQVVWDFVQEWMRKAESDLRAAEHLLRLEQEDYFTAAFHAQQAAEKFLKAFLVRHQILFGKTHDIQELLKLAGGPDAPLRRELASAEMLTAFGVEFRYPGGQVADLETAQKAVAEAARLRAKVLEHLEDYLKGGRPAPHEAGD